MASMVITDTYMKAIREAAAAEVKDAQYRIGTKWIRAEIVEASVQLNGSVHISFYVMKDKDQPNTGVNALRVRNKSGVALVTKTDSVPFSAGVDRLLYRFKIAIQVVQGEG